MTSARTTGNIKFAKTGSEKLKRVPAHAAIEVQLPFVLSHGAGSCGQQSDIFIAAGMSPELAMSIEIDDVTCTAAVPAASGFQQCGFYHQ